MTAKQTPCMRPHIVKSGAPWFICWRFVYLLSYAFTNVTWLVVHPMGLSGSFFIFCVILSSVSTLLLNHNLVYTYQPVVVC